MIDVVLSLHGVKADCKARVTKTQIVVVSGTIRKPSMGTALGGLPYRFRRGSFSKIPATNPWVRVALEGRRQSRPATVTQQHRRGERMNATERAERAFMDAWTKVNREWPWGLDGAQWPVWIRAQFEIFALPMFLAGYDFGVDCVRANMNDVSVFGVGASPE